MKKSCFLPWLIVVLLAMYCCGCGNIDENFSQAMDGKDQALHISACQMVGWGAELVKNGRVVIVVNCVPPKGNNNDTSNPERKEQRKEGVGNQTTEQARASR